MEDSKNICDYCGIEFEEKDLVLVRGDRKLYHARMGLVNETLFPSCAGKQSKEEGGEPINADNFYIYVGDGKYSRNLKDLEPLRFLDAIRKATIREAERAVEKLGKITPEHVGFDPKPYGDQVMFYRMVIAL